MLEIDLPRMQSLSPQFDSSPLDSIPGVTNFNLNDITETPEPDPDPSCSSLEVTKTCDWTYESGTCGCKTSCGCKYINKVRFIYKFQSMFTIMCFSFENVREKKNRIRNDAALTPNQCQNYFGWVLCSEQCHNKPLNRMRQRNLICNNSFICNKMSHLREISLYNLNIFKNKYSVYHFKFIHTFTFFCSFVSQLHATFIFIIINSLSVRL